MSLTTSRIAQLAAAAGAGALIAGGGFALASSGSSTIHGCVGTKSHVLTVQARCPRGTRKLVWSVQGPRGLTGRAGAAGAAGATGAAGPAGVVPWTIDYGYITESSDINLCGIVQTRGLTSCKYLGVGYYQVTATGCDASGSPATGANVQLTPDATAQIGQGQASPTYEVDAEVDGYVSGPSDQLTFGIRVLGSNQGAAPAPVDASVYVQVDC